jgi:hypothetical protein
LNFISLLASIRYKVIHGQLNLFNAIDRWNIANIAIKFVFLSY